MDNRPRPRIYPAKPSDKAYSWFVEQFGIEDAADEFEKRYKGGASDFLPMVEEEPKAEAPPKAPKKAPRKKKKGA